MCLPSTWSSILKSSGNIRGSQQVYSFLCFNTFKIEHMFTLFLMSIYAGWWLCRRNRSLLEFQVCMFSDCRHLPHWEHPGEYNLIWIEIEDGVWRLEQMEIFERKQDLQHSDYSNKQSELLVWVLVDMDRIAIVWEYMWNLALEILVYQLNYCSPF